MRISFVRHATFMFESGGQRVMVDPMLAAAEATGPVANTPNQRRNPLVDLPFGAEGTLALLEETDVVLVTHVHNDHWDDRARDLIPRHTPILCQPEDWDEISASGFRRVTPVDDGLQWDGLGFTRTGGRHGTGRSEISWERSPASWSGRRVLLPCTWRGTRSSAPRSRKRWMPMSQMSSSSTRAPRDSW